MLLLRRFVSAYMLCHALLAIQCDAYVCGRVCVVKVFKELLCFHLVLARYTNPASPIWMFIVIRMVKILKRRLIRLPLSMPECDFNIAYPWLAYSMSFYLVPIVRRQKAVLGA